jgi:hypothetical protein
MNDILEIPSEFVPSISLVNFYRKYAIAPLQLMLALFPNTMHLQPNACPVCRIPLIKDLNIIPVCGSGGNDRSATSMDSRLSKLPRNDHPKFES